MLDPLLELAHSFIDANKRVYFGYLLASVVIALGFWALTHKGANQCGKLLSSKYWLHRSSKRDLQLLLINPFIKFIGWKWFTFSAIPIAIVINRGLENTLGSFSIDASNVTVMVCFTTALFIADDFSRFLLHRAMHKSSILWAFHRLHHSAEVLTPFTIYRVHPIESLLYSLRSMVTQGLVIGVFIYLFGLHLSVWQVLGANIFTVAFNYAGANLRHSHVWISYGRYIEQWLISPAQHQIHHSANKSHWNKNYGSFIAIWDRVFGSLLLAKNNKPFRFGLGQQGKYQSSLTQEYVAPFLYLSNYMKVTFTQTLVPDVKNQ